MGGRCWCCDHWHFSRQVQGNILLWVQKSWCRSISLSLKLPGITYSLQDTSSQRSCHSQAWNHLLSFCMSPTRCSQQNHCEILAHTPNHPVSSPVWTEALGSTLAWECEVKFIEHWRLDNRVKLAEFGDCSGEKYRICHQEQELQIP